jgi:acyl transferase domain-containing protein
LGLHETGAALPADIQDHVRPCGSELNAFILPGNVLSVAAGRLSFMFGLKGPSLAVDTACSSSIVSAHMAGCCTFKR